MATITGLHHIALTVTDLDASERFYSTVFGFTRLLELPDEEGRGAKRILLHADSATVLGFTTHAGNDGSPFSEFRSGLDHLAFGVASLEELAAWGQHFDALGIEHSEIRDAQVGDLMTVRDPDNIQVELWVSR
jgi:catechol 2,3-dioxygenase-like lactoylglutathione lyase family enzyme